MYGQGWGDGIRRGITGLFPAALITLLLISPPSAEAQSLQGSRASLDRQNEQAQLHDFTYLRTPEDVRRFVEAGYLVPVRPNQDFDVHNVSFPYARPEVRTFIHRLASQYRAACGEKLVVTSLTRPITRQPPNASSRSVHPTGMALDLRVSQNARCRSWLESTLLSLERQGVLEAIRERRPPHYHVAVFPQPYANYVTQRTGDQRFAQDDRAPEVRLEMAQHQVRRGETLTQIARRYDTSVSRLQAENGLRSGRILAGQTLRVPVYREVPAEQATQVAQAQGASADEASGDGGSVTASSAGPQEHRVTRGESLWAIARRYGTTVETLRRANGLSSNRIVAGQALTIPAMEEGARGARALVEHTVQPGESLWTIARRHGTTVNQIQNRNGISNNRIHPGQVLTVPLGGS